MRVRGQQRDLQLGSRGVLRKSTDLLNGTKYVTSRGASGKVGDPAVAQQQSANNAAAPPTIDKEAASIPAIDEQKI
jgi:hypothetical protein